MNATPKGAKTVSDTDADSIEAQITADERARRRAFVAEHRTAIFGYNRNDDGPSMSCVYYVCDGEDLLVSTMAERAKAKAIARSPKVSLCVLDEQWPPAYLVVYCDATIETDAEAVVELMMRIAGVMAGQPMPEEVRPTVADAAALEQRVVVRLRPYATFRTPPKHVYEAEDIDPRLVHSLGQTMPWP
jgi:PPOX class probable F420-dependent enzyme